MLAVRAYQGVISKRRQNSSSPLIKAVVDMMFAFGNGTIEFGINFSVTCINPTIPNHFKMFFRNVANETLDEFHSRNRFFYVLFILMPVVMESDHFTIVFINSGCGNDRATKITPNVFYNNSGIAEVGFGINIKTLLVFTITFRLHFFERRTDFGFHFIEQSRAKSIA